MKTPFSLLAMSFLILGFAACDRHEWEDTTDASGNTVKGTKRLFQAHHGDEKGEKHDTHGAKEGEHKSDAAH